MKKIFLTTFLGLICIVFAFFVPINTNVCANAFQYSENQVKTTMLSAISDLKEFDERIAGSKDEESTMECIQNFLVDSNAIAVENSFIKNGVQKFRFQSIFDGEYYNSYNLIYKIPARINTDKKLIFSCSYDSFAYSVDKYGNYLLTSTEGINQSAGSVALMLALAKYLPANNFDFNIEFVFFGAGSSNGAGSEFYTQGISDDDAKNILLAINFDTISLGANLYFYVDEIETKLSSFTKNLFIERSCQIDEIKVANLGKTLVDDNGLGLTYTHIAQSNNTLNFMKSNVLTMNLFAGDYSSGISVGRCEYNDKESITYTSSDNYDNISKKYGINTVANNLLEVFSSINMLISNEDFVLVCTSSFGQTSWFYKVFGNQSLVIVLTAILLMIFVIISLVIHYNLTVKSYNTNIENDFVSVVLNMSANVDTKSKDDVTKRISEIVATDIKKNKRIKKK